MLNTAILLGTAQPRRAPAPGKLHVAVVARDAVRHADLSARVALAGHAVIPDKDAADVVLADAGAPALRLVSPADAGGSLFPADLPPAQLDAALHAVAAGLRVSLPGAPEAPRPLLTPRELEILACLGEGLSNKAVARRLNISAHTVKFHLEAVFLKLGVASRSEAVAKGLRRGLILL